MNRTRLAIIDQDQQQRNALYDFFKTQHTTFHRVYAFNSIDTFLSDSYLFPDLDIVLINTNLQAGLSCSEGIKYMRQHTSQAKIILLDAMGDRNEIFRLLCKGATSYTQAAASFDTIGHTVLSALGNRDRSAGEMLLFRNDKEMKKNKTESKIHHLTNREQEVVERIMLGEGQKTIATNLHISERLVKRYLFNAYHKLQYADVLNPAVVYRNVG